MKINGKATTAVTLCVDDGLVSLPHPGDATAKRIIRAAVSHRRRPGSGTAAIIKASSANAVHDSARESSTSNPSRAEA
jgi:hypothetical protein